MELVFLFIGLFIAFVIDILWWNQKSFKKLEQGIEFHEHYHIGLELIILYIILTAITGWSPLIILMGAGIGFVLAEWSQHHEIKGKKVVPGHPFAYGSKHFKMSTIVGVFLFSIMLILTLLL